MFSSIFTSLPATEISQIGSLPVSDELSFQSGTISDFDAFETDQREVDSISVVLLNIKLASLFFKDKKP